MSSSSRHKLRLSSTHICALCALLELIIACTCPWSEHNQGARLKGLRTHRDFVTCALILSLSVPGLDSLSASWLCSVCFDSAFRLFILWYSVHASYDPYLFTTLPLPDVLDLYVCMETLSGTYVPVRLQLTIYWQRTFFSYKLWQR